MNLKEGKGRIRCVAVDALKAQRVAEKVKERAMQGVA